MVIFPEEIGGKTGIAESIEKPRRSFQGPVPAGAGVQRFRETGRTSIMRKGKEILFKDLEKQQQRSSQRRQRPSNLKEFQLSRQQQISAPDQENWHQQAFHDMMGGGEKIWGWKNEPVYINETLTSGEGLIKGTERLSDNDAERRTAQMFGF